MLEAPTQWVVMRNSDMYVSDGWLDELMGELRRKNRELQESFESLKRTTSAKERMESELNIGRDIQMGMLPAADLHTDAVSVSGFCQPAVEVGGDFYDFIELDDGCQILFVGDVTGHGLESGVVMVMTQVLLMVEM